MLETVIFLLQVGLTSNFVPVCQTVPKSCKNHGLKKFSCSIRFKTCFCDSWQLIWQWSRDCLAKLSCKTQTRDIYH